MPLRRFAAGLLLLAITTPAYAAPLPFPDMEGSWYRYREAVAYLQERDVISGYPDGTFRPREEINRAEFLKIVFKGRTDGTPISRKCFDDVPTDAWFAPYVCAAKNRGIVDGYPDGTYQPERTINFAEAIKIILNSYDYSIGEGQGEQWFKPYVDELDVTGVLRAHSYLPWDDLNRERAADLLWRVLRYQDEQFQPSLSPGCGKAKPAPPSSVTVDGQTRNFLLTVPDGYVSHDPTQLIVAFHGRTNSNEQVRSYYRLDRTIKDAIIAYPAALSNGNGSFSWADNGDTAYQLRDIAFFDAIVEDLANKYCIDMDNIFVVGHSLGAWFANSIACVRGDVVRASATVGGDSVITDCAGPAAALIAHNPDDRLAPFAGSERVREQRIEENGCNWETSSAQPEEFSCVQHASCGENTVLFCPHEIDTDSRGTYYPHNWPRETASYIQEFFESLRD